MRSMLPSMARHDASHAACGNNTVSVTSLCYHHAITLTYSLPYLDLISVYREREILSNLSLTSHVTSLPYRSLLSILYLVYASHYL